jgi:hypothetical protein
VATARQAPTLDELEAMPAYLPPDEWGERIAIRRRYAAWCEARGAKAPWPPDPAGGTLERFRAGFEAREGRSVCRAVGAQARALRDGNSP